ncbi:MAG TPA: Xaa-Pro peptidase family protein [Dehalococcoidia bacterium]|nr:Xaa-Pro peptidase family protein [Dehalococcoidia bacterium]
MTTISAPSSTARRLERLRAAIAEHGLDAVLISNTENRRYLSGFSGSAGVLVITASHAVIATDFRYYEQAEQQAPEFRLHKTVGGLQTWFRDLARDLELGGKKLGFEAADLTFQAYQQHVKIIQELPEPERPKLVATTSLVESLRVIKDPEELQLLQRVIDIGDAAMAYVQRAIEPGWTEKRVAWEIEKHIREHGGDSLSFPTIVAAGPHSALAHAQPRDRAIEEGEMVVIDMGARLDGYCSDLTRTIFLGEPDDKFLRIYDIVAVAQRTAIETIEAGMTGEQAHMQAHAVIEEAGYGDAFGHGLGHGIGLQVHENPRLARTSGDILREGMVFSIEPGIYLSGWGGVRIEDLATLENGKVRLLSHAPYWNERGTA